MAAKPQVSQAAAIAALNALLALLNVGGAGSIKVYSGSAPADVAAALGGATLLGTLPLSATSFPTAVGGTNEVLATANAITSDTSADASGTASFFRAVNNAGTAVIQGTVGTSLADMIVNTTAVTAGDTIACTSWIARMSTGV